MKGYTLLEILVALSITAIVFVVGVAGFRAFSRRQALIAAARSIHGDLRLAQEQALAGKKPSGCVTLTGYSFTTSSDSYEVRAVCTDGNYLIKSQEVPEGVSLSPLPAVNPIVFKVLGQGTNIPSGSDAVITILQTATNDTRTVTISWTGEVRQ